MTKRRPCGMKIPYGHKGVKGKSQKTYAKKAGQKGDC